MPGWTAFYKDILRHGKADKNHLTPSIALYLYGRSFFLNDVPVNDAHKAAVDYSVMASQAKKYWLRIGQSAIAESVSPWH